MARSNILLPALPFLFLACFAGSCDHTVLSGTVKGPTEFRVGTPVELRLEVPQELEAIYWELWRVEPTEAGHFEPAEDQGRQVTFVPERPGPALIQVQGFFRQTNPQPITEQPITILP